MFTLEKVTPILKDTYIAVIKNSVGTKMFQDSFAYIGTGRRKKKVNITERGKASCAFFVSNILLMFGEHGLIKTQHGGVVGLVKDLEHSGWRKIRTPRIGSVIVWEPKVINGNMNEHVGFYIGKDKAVSNDWESRVPKMHHATYGRKKGVANRKISAIYWNSKFDR